MGEFRRIFTRGRLLASFVLIIFLNIALFLNEQSENDYGFSRYTTDFYTKLYGEIDSREYKDAYLSLIEKFRHTALSEVQQSLIEQKEMLGMYNELKSILLAKAASESLANGSDYLDPYHPELYDYYKSYYPDLVSALERGEIPDTSTLRVNSIAVGKLLEHVNNLLEYPDYLKTVQENAAKSQAFAFLGGKDSFNGRNTIKTASEFKKLEGVVLELGVNEGIEAFMLYRVADYLLLLIMILICLAFVEERKKGLWSIVHSSRNGRMRLTLRRVGILLVVSAAAVTVLHGTVLFASFQIYGGINDIDRAVQSAEIFQKLPVIATFGELLAQYIVVRILTSFLLCLLLWFLISLLSDVKYTIIILAAFLISEYALFAFLPVQSAGNILKYFNIFSYIDLSSLYTNYLNINLFGYPFGIRSIALYAAAPLCAALIGGCIWIQCGKKPFGWKDPFDNIAYRLNTISDWILKNLHLLGIELYKTMILQRGAIIVALFLYIAAGLDFTAFVPQVHADLLSSEMEGPIGDDLLRKIDNIQAEIDAGTAKWKAIELAWERGEVDYATYYAGINAYSGTMTMSAALSEVRVRVQLLESIGSEIGSTLWILNNKPYESVYGKAAEELQARTAIISLTTLSLLLAGCFAFDNQSGVSTLLASTVKGRKKLLFCKYGTAALVTVFVWGVVYGLELYEFFSSYKITSLSAPVQSLTMLHKFPLKISIGGFLALLYLYRLLMLLCSACIILFISSGLKKTDIAYLAACGVTAVPALLYFYAGLTPLKYISMALPVVTMNLITSEGGSPAAPIAAGLLMLSVSAVAAAYTLRSYSPDPTRRGLA